MNTILDAVVMWVLGQVLLVWFCSRVVRVRELELKDYLELQDRLGRRGLDVDAFGSLPVASTAEITARRIPPAGVARA